MNEILRHFKLCELIEDNYFSESFVNKLFEKFYSKNKKEIEILQGLKTLFNYTSSCEYFNFFRSKKYSFIDKSLYDIACDIEKFNKEESYYDIFTDYPLCDELVKYYDEFPDECAIYADEKFVHSNIDLSELNELKLELAQNMIKCILLKFKEKVDNLLKFDSYEEKVELLNDLEALEYKDLPFELEFEVKIDSSYKEFVMDLDTLNLSQRSKEELKEFLKNNKDFTTENNQINQFLELEKFKKELECENLKNLNKETNTNKRRLK